MAAAAFTLSAQQETIPFSPTFKIPPKPGVQTSVYDYANIFKEAEKKSLEEKLLTYSDSTSTQIVIITIESLKGENIGELTPRWAHQWGIGQADKDNGVLILLAEAEHEIWISPGYGVDDRLTAGQLGQMIRDIIIPEFKSGNYYSGLDKGTDAIFRMLTGKYKAQPNPNENGEVGKGWKTIQVILYLLLAAGGIFLYLWLTRNKKAYAAANAAISYSSFGSSSYTPSRSTYTPSRSSTSSGSSSRSGFRGGFGGGGFSGGGAGGKW
ncbi:methanol dehydrogenase [Flavobacterium album]|uniref:Methanol dehydrogenase n=1 Tax=Flavobacterium album TaxID=2175091 RepID=A0A2S1QXJ4_9FLAO|nr:methanol dehydrogenase [Flavobacterium album]